MTGALMLAGGSEFSGQMAAPDRAAIAAAGGPGVEMAIIPAAAAPDHNDIRAGQNAERWFRQLGAQKVQSLPLIDRSSADNPAIVDRFKRARLIYLLGGFPYHLANSLKGSRSWRAIMEAYRSGAVIAGSSAGAMVLCDDFFDPSANAFATGLGLLSKTCIIPHHDTTGRQWLHRLKKTFPDNLLVGIDEETAMLTAGTTRHWKVHGKGQITLYRGGEVIVWRPGETFSTEDRA
jgi:cyanophycinase